MESKSAPSKQVSAEMQPDKQRQDGEMRAPNDIDDQHLKQHVDRLRSLGLLTWSVLCKGTSPYEPSSDDPALGHDELPYEDVFNAGLPLMRNDTVLLSNGRCYSRAGMRQWIGTFRVRTVRPRFPDTRRDLQLADLLLLDIDRGDATTLLDRPSHDAIVAAADRGDADARRLVRAEQSAVAVAARASEPLDIEPLQANNGRSWFHRIREEPGTVEQLLRNKPVGAFVVLWPPDSETRGSLAYVDQERNISRAALTYAADSGYRSPDIAHLIRRYGTVREPPRFLSLTQLLLERPTLRWPRDALPMAGYRGTLSANDAVQLLWPQPLGTYIIRRSSRDPYQLVITFRDRDQVTHFTVRVHSGIGSDNAPSNVYGFAAPEDRVGHRTLEQYIDALDRASADSVLPSTPL